MNLFYSKTASTNFGMRLIKVVAHQHSESAPLTHIGVSDRKPNSQMLNRRYTPNSCFWAL